MQDTLRCPTCRAVQEWSDACRRCKCDLRLLRAAATAYRESRKRCLLDLRAGQIGSALAHARHCLWLQADAESRRLLALCALRSGDWSAALSLARTVPSERGPSERGPSERGPSERGPSERGPSEGGPSEV